MSDWVLIALRTLLAVVVLFAMTKLLGKRQVSQLSLFEYITGITIGSLAAYISLDLEASWYLGMVSLIVWILVTLGIEIMQLKSKTVRDFIDSKATVLIQDGKILEDNLKKERLTADELMEQLRKKDVFYVGNVEFAIMETSGEVNILLKPEYRPLTAKELGLTLQPEPEPHVVVMDGQIMNEALRKAGVNQAWLNAELEKKGVAVEEVFLGEVNARGKLYLDLFADQTGEPEQKRKAGLLEVLKKCEADFHRYSQSEKDEKTKKMFEGYAKELQRLIEEAKPSLIR